MGRRFPRWWTSAAAREAGTRLRRRLFRRRFLGRVDRVIKREGEGGRERWSLLLVLLSYYIPSSFESLRIERALST